MKANSINKQDSKSANRTMTWFVGPVRCELHRHASDGASQDLPEPPRPCTRIQRTMAENYLSPFIEGVRSYSLATSAKNGYSDRK